MNSNAALLLPTESDPLHWVPTPERLQKLAMSHAASYQTASPFPHIVLDDFLPQHAVESVWRSFPSPEEPFWLRTHIAQEIKLSTCTETVFPSPVRSLLYALNGASFLSFLEKLTGITGLIPDPYFEGGGIHQTVRGGKLGVHVDFNKNAKLKLDRRLNLLVYLNKDWPLENGGNLELWEGKRQKCVQSIAPLFNRCVVFSTTETSYHGHPHPLTCPPDTSRKSLALYYYTVGTPREIRGYVHGTEFLQYTQSKSARARLRFALVKAVRECLPPVLYRALKSFLTRLHP